LQQISRRLGPPPKKVNGGQAAADVVDFQDWIARIGQGPGHWFNAVKHEGTVLAVDGQAGLFEEWPPSKDGLGFDENGMSYSDAVYFTADGKVARNDHQ